MARVIEAYCSKEVSELLKKKGFLKDIDLRLKSNLAYYTCTGLQYNIAKWYDSLIQDKIDFVVAPTHQMAMAWLREVHNIDICVFPYQEDYVSFSYKVKIYKDKEMYLSITDSKTYEEGVEIALNYCLEIMI